MTDGRILCESDPAMHVFAPFITQHALSDDESREKGITFCDGEALVEQTVRWTAAIERMRVEINAANQTTETNPTKLGCDTV